MSKAQLFVQHHWTQMIVVFVLTVAAVTLNVINEDVWQKKKPTGQVLGQEAVKEEKAQTEKDSRAIIGYQTGLKSALDEYLTKRATLANNQEEWLRLMDESQAKILALGVPDEYKDLHLKVVTNLDLEKRALIEKDEALKESANNTWEKILAQFFWLNN